MSPLRNLNNGNVECNWTKYHSIVFQKIKNIVTEIPVLKIFDPKLPIEIQTNASQNGIGSCLLQQGKLVAFCSCNMIDTDSRWAQIEKEYLAISIQF